MNRDRILLAGIGNIFLGDDAFGVEVVRRLIERGLPPGVRAVDFGIRGLDLAYALLDGYETAILVDAVPRGGRPGTLYVIEPAGDGEPESLSSPAADFSPLEMHSLDPAKVMAFARRLGGALPRVLVVGCEPRLAADAEEMAMGLSEPVRAAVEEGVDLVESLVARLLAAGSEPALR
jgi:hydrogenase maturation protease